MNDHYWVFVLYRHQLGWALPMGVMGMLLLAIGMIQPMNYQIAEFSSDLTWERHHNRQLLSQPQPPEVQIHVAMCGLIDE